MKQEMIRHDFVRSKLFPAQRNELLCKLIAYNLCNLVHCKMEFGVQVDFLKYN